MRRRPNKETLEKKIIDNASVYEHEDDERKDIIKRDSAFVSKQRWPIYNTPINPTLREGSTNRRLLTISLTEYELNSINHHTSELGVSKSEWMRYACFKLMQEEQEHYKLKDSKKD